MEIIHVVLGKANPSRMNGVNKVVHELATRQQQRGEAVSLWGITRYPKHDYPGRVYTTSLFRAHRNPFRLDRALKKAVEGKGKDTVFHLHGGFIPAFYSLAVALHKRRIPYVFTAHGSYNTVALERNRRRKSWYFRLFEKKVLTYARAIHCLGRSEVDGLQQIFPNKKTNLIPYGFDGSPMRSNHAGEDKFIIGFCGRLDIHTKGLDLLLQAFSKFQWDAPTAELWLIGDSPSRGELENLARRLGIRSQTVFFGSRFGEEKLELLQQVHVFAHPSRNEGLPTAVLEAAALGIPCVITEATNVGEPVRRYGAGEVVARPDGLLLAEALRRLYKLYRAKRLAVVGMQARKMIGECFDWNVILGDFHRLYQPA